MITRYILVFSLRRLLLALALVVLVSHPVSAHDREFTAVKYVSNQADALVVVRPAKFFDSQTFKQLDARTDGRSLKLAGLLSDTVFKMSLAEINQIDEIIICAKQQLDREDESAFIYTIIRTKDDNEVRFEMATHSSATTETYRGRDILELPRGGLNGLRFACIIDDKTIVWSYGIRGIRVALDASEDDFRSSKLHSAWERYEKQAVSFGFNSRLLQNLKLPDFWRTGRIFSGGFSLDSSCELTVSALCADQADAENVAAVIRGLLSRADADIDNLALPVNKAVLVEAKKLTRSIVDAGKFEIKRESLEFATRFVVDAASLAPLVEDCITEIHLRNDVARRRKLGKALVGFEMAYRRPLSPVVVRESKKHSWRVRILPFVGEPIIYSAYRFEEDWDSPHNRQVTSKMPDVFRSSESGQNSNESAWYLLYGRSAAFDLTDNTRRMSDIADGLSSTIIAVETNHKSHWAKPDDIELSPEILPELGGFHQHGFHAIFADGQSYFLRNDIEPEVLYGLMTCNRGETIVDSQWKLDRAHELRAEMRK